MSYAWFTPNDTGIGAYDPWIMNTLPPPAPSLWDRIDAWVSSVWAAIFGLFK